MKKLVSLGLALVMCLALAIPALATEETFETENSAFVPTVEVELPSSGLVILNPYKMSYTDKTVVGTTPSTAQIISNVFSLTNKTQGGNLQVKIKATGVVGGNATLVAKVEPTKSTANDVALTLKYGVTNTPTKTAPASVPTTNNATLVLNDSEQDVQISKADIVLAPATSAGNTFITFAFEGTANEKAETPWTEDDTVGATFVFTFAPTSDKYTGQS